MQMMASYFLVSASWRAANGISNAPGTRARTMSFLFAPERRRPSIALSNNLSVMKELKRETTRAKHLPAAFREPSSAGSSGVGRFSVTKAFLFLMLFFVAAFSVVQF